MPRALEEAYHADDAYWSTPLADWCGPKRDPHRAKTGLRMPLSLGSHGSDRGGNEGHHVSACLLCRRLDLLVGGDGLMIERRDVGDAVDAQHARTHVVQGNGLGGRAHAHGVRAKARVQPRLRGRLVCRAGHLQKDDVMEGDAEVIRLLVKDLAKIRVVNLAHVRKALPQL